MNPFPIPIIIIMITVLLWYFQNPLSLASPQWVHSVNREVVRGDEVLWNWGNTFYFTPTTIVKPKNLLELVSAVESASGIRVVGGGHSFNPQIATDETLIDLSDFLLPGGLAYELSSNSNSSSSSNVNVETVRVAGGVKIRHLQHYLIGLGYVVHGFGGGTHYQTIAGGISTNLHGSQNKIFAQHVVSLGVVLANGTIVSNITAEDDLFHGVKSGMGRLGVIYEVEINVHPRTCFRLEASEQSLAEAVELLSQENVYGEFKFLASTAGTKGIVHRYVPINETCPIEYSIESSYDRSAWDTYVSDNWLMAAQVLLPSATSWDFVYSYFKDILIDMDQEIIGVENGWRYDVAPQYGQLFTEYAVPIPNCTTALLKLLDFVDEIDYQLSSTTIRFLEEEPNTLLAFSPVPSCTLEVYSSPAQYKVDEMLLGVQEIVYLHGGRSHLGKTYNPTVRPISERTNGLVNEFEDLCNIYDPNDLFKPTLLNNTINYDIMARRAIAFRFFVGFSFTSVILSLIVMIVECCRKDSGYRKLS